MKGFYQSKNSRVLFLLLMIIVFIRSALRSYGVGNDTETYLHIYSAVSSIENFADVFRSGLIYNIEIGYLVLNWICANLINHYQSILIVSSIIAYIGYYKFLKKYSISLLLAFATFFLLRFSDEVMNIIRQSIALVFILKSYDYIKLKKKKKFIISVVIAMLFHKSAFVFFPAWWICRFNFNKKMIIRFLCSSIVLMFLLKVGTAILLSLMGGYADYMSDDYDYSSGGKIAPCINILMYSIILMFVNRQIKISKGKINPDMITDMMMMRNLLFTGICILIISLSNALIFRVAIYYYIFVIALFPNAIQMSRNRSFWSVAIFVSLLTYYCIIIKYRPDWNFVYPYSFFWEQPFLP